MGWPIPLLFYIKITQFSGRKPTSDGLGGEQSVLPSILTLHKIGHVTQGELFGECHPGNSYWNKDGFVAQTGPISPPQDLSLSVSRED